MIDRGQLEIGHPNISRIRGRHEAVLILVRGDGGHGSQSHAARGDHHGGNVIGGVYRNLEGHSGTLGHFLVASSLVDAGNTCHGGHIGPDQSDRVLGPHRVQGLVTGDIGNGFSASTSVGCSGSILVFAPTHKGISRTVGLSVRNGVGTTSGHSTRGGDMIGIDRIAIESDGAVHRSGIHCDGLGGFRIDHAGHCILEGSHRLRPDGSRGGEGGAGNALVILIGNNRNTLIIRAVCKLHIALGHIRSGRHGEVLAGLDRIGGSGHGQSGLLVNGESSRVGVGSQVANCQGHGDSMAADGVAPPGNRTGNLAS